MNAPPTDRQATRRVPAQRHPQRHPQRPSQRPPRQRDVLDVTLNDEELRAETELTALLMVAVNDAVDTDDDGPLPQDQIDRLLGLV